MGFARSGLVFLWMAITVVPMATLIIITTPFTSADARWWYLARPWLRGAVQAVRLVGGVDYAVAGEGWLPASEDNQRIILCPKHQSTWETFFLASRMPHPLAYVFKREPFHSILRLGHGVPEYDSHRPQRAGRGMEQGCRAG